MENYRRSKVDRERLPFQSAPKHFLRKGDRNKAFAISMISNAQKMFAYDSQSKDDVAYKDSKDSRSMKQI